MTQPPGPDRNARRPSGTTPPGNAPPRGIVQTFHQDVIDDEAFDIRDRAVDAEAIMERIRASIRAKRDAGILRDESWLARRLDELGLPGALRETTDRLALIRMAGRLDPNGDPLKSHRPIIGRLIVAVKRATRYWIRKYTDTIFTRQAHFNAEVTRLLADLVRENEDLRRRVDALDGASGAASRPEVPETARVREISAP